MTSARRAMIALTALASLGPASCGGEEPPAEGHHLLLTFTSLDPQVIDEVRLRFSPQAIDQDFTMIEPMSFADGAIELTVGTDGRLVMTIDGEHIAASAVQQDEIRSYVYDLEVYSDDETMRPMAPYVTVAVSRDGELIASGDGYLPAWPLPLSQSTEIMIPCTAAPTSLCLP